MGTVDLKTLASEVLVAYQNKDVGFFENIFSDDVMLRDWNSEVVGKDAALTEFAKNFDAAQTLSLRVVGLFNAEHSVAAQVEILVNGDLLRVVDIITFNADNKILSIVAYKGL